MERTEKQFSLLEQFTGKLKNLYQIYKPAFLTSMICGLIAHAYMFFNKLPSYDDITFFFSKGATFTHGRWALGILEAVLPSVSMPWLLGLLSLFFLSVNACFVIELLKIRNKILQGILAGISVTFPYFTSLFTFMFTSFSYTLAIILMTVSIWLFLKKSVWCKLISVFMAAFALGIYQPYIMYMLGLAMLMVMGDCISCSGEEKLKFKQIFLKGLSLLGLIAAAAVLYFVLNKAVQFVTGIELSEYGVSKTAGENPLFRIVPAYKDFFYRMINDDYGFMGTRISKGLHLLLGAGSLLLIVIHTIRKRSAAKTVLFLAMIVLMPLALNCLYLVFDGNFHTVMEYGRICIYLLPIILMEHFVQNGSDSKIKMQYLIRDAGILVMTGLILINTYVSNRAYLNLQMVYETTASQCTVLISKIESLEGYDRFKPVLILGTAEKTEAEEGFASGGQRVFGVFDAWTHLSYSDQFMEVYLGHRHFLLSQEERSKFEQDERVAEMACYPDEGSIQIIDDVIVVKLSEVGEENE